MSSLRDANLQSLSGGSFDVLVVGGGINGAVSAACLAGRGAKVALVDRGDFAGFTSQQSSNLAWGGIKYMESFEFGLVHELCRSRNHLIRSYPSTVQEIRFFAVHPRGFRHSLFKLLVGAWLYWIIGAFFTRRPRRLTTADIAREEPLVDLDKTDGGFEYSDAYLHDNDARFVWNFVRASLDQGGVAANYVEVTGAERVDEGWKVRARDVITGREVSLTTKVIVNACGPFVDALNAKLGEETEYKHVFSKGIHLLVPRITEHHRVLTFFADDGRPFFVLPMGPRTCIGTTDTRVEDPHTQVTDEDRAFVLDNINKRLRLDKPLTTDDVIAERCGVRPLAVKTSGESSTVDWMQLSRKHVVEVDAPANLVSVFGGKLTDCLNVGEEVADEVARLGVPMPTAGRRWYGEPTDDERQRFFAAAQKLGLDAMTSPRSSEKLTPRLWRRYGTRANAMLDAIRKDRAEGEVLIAGAEYIRCEIEHAARREMIVKLDDFLRRRSKIALVIAHDELQGAPGLREACRLLFGDDADLRYDEYFGVQSVSSGASRQDSAASVAST